jgi:outer membrane beta-barrel protein
VRKLLLAVFLLPTFAYAQEDTDEAPGATQAIQERTYRMGFELGLGGGVLPLDPFTKQVYAQAAASFHFTDAIAWQVARFAYAYNWESGLRNQLERDFAVLPNNFDQIQFFVGSDLVFTPFYGKVDVANRWVVHYEAYILVGAVVFKYNNGFRPGVDIGGGFRIFQNKVLSYRFEIIDSVIVTGSVGNALAASLMLCINIGSTE